MSVEYGSVFGYGWVISPADMEKLLEENGEEFGEWACPLDAYTSDTAYFLGVHVSSIEPGTAATVSLTPTQENQLSNKLIKEYPLSYLSGITYNGEQYFKYEVARYWLLSYIL